MKKGRMAAEEQLRRLVEAQGFPWKIIEDVKSGIAPSHSMNPSVTIYTIPKTLRHVNEDAYRVQVQEFRINGPIEETSKWSEQLNGHALVHDHSILSRNPDKCFEDYVMAMDDLSDQIRSCHVNKFVVDTRRLILAVAHGCFIVDLLLLFYERSLTTMDRNCTSVLHTLWIDMLLVENQIPFFLLQRIFDMAVVDKSQFPPLVEIALHFFKQFVDLNKQRPPMESKDVHHLLHLVHTLLLPINTRKAPQRGKFHKLIELASKKLKSLLWRNLSQQLPISNINPPSKPFIIRPIPTARKLQEAGIQFKKKEQSGFSDITFKRPVLEIPCLWVDINTNPLLRNLIAWEQCHPIAGTYFTSYAIFMGYIVTSTSDAEVLNQAGILEGSSKEQVAWVFNNLNTNVVYNEKEDNILPQLCQELNEYYGNQFNLWWAKLLSDYFSTPWSVVSLVAAFVLIMLTMTQTFYAVYAYVHPP
ncbi:UPF0481 protein At3g47200-like [Aristolochia californica]|uniref:UPF0481 protein At3g47200-like n=1 Tax=Aristolochia californica TaxID=171875 RepID=UPI0035E3701E